MLNFGNTSAFHDIKEANLEKVQTEAERGFYSGAEFPVLLHVIRHENRASLILLGQGEGGGAGVGWCGQSSAYLKETQSFFNM